MFSKRVENTVGKEEIAHYEQFLLSHGVFQKTRTADTGLFGKWFSVKVPFTVTVCMVLNSVF